MVEIDGRREPLARLRCSHTMRAGFGAHGVFIYGRTRCALLAAHGPVPIDLSPEEGFFEIPADSWYIGRTET